MFAVESVRARTIQDMMHEGVQKQTTDLPVPLACDWDPCPVAAPDQMPKIEAIANCVPEECFYLRFGSWGNQVWLKKLMADYGGDMSRMVQLRGLRVSRRCQHAGSARSWNLLRLTTFLAEMSLPTSLSLEQIFMSTMVQQLASFLSPRQDYSRATWFRAEKHSQKKKTMSNCPISRSVMSRQPSCVRKDNRYRSILISHKNIHLVTNCLVIAERFIEAANGKKRLSDHPEFQHARLIYPLERDDTIFAYLSADFFQQLLSPSIPNRIAAAQFPDGGSSDVSTCRDDRQT